MREMKLSKGREFMSWFIPNIAKCQKNDAKSTRDTTHHKRIFV